MVHKHRGDIKVTSEPGKTCFQVWLPLKAEAKYGVVGSMYRTENGGGVGPRY